MPNLVLRWTLAARPCLVLAVAMIALHAPLSAQIPSGQQLPSPDQARDMLRNQPALVEQLRQRLAQSGLTPDQVRSRLRAAGYPESLLDQYLTGADTTQPVQMEPRTLEAVRALGVLSAEETDSIQKTDSVGAVSDSLRRVLDSLRFVRTDSLRADSLADTLRALDSKGLKIFGLETFRRATTRFQASEAGPVDENYRLGPGDVLVLILTGDVERAHTLQVTREGFVVIPQVGQVYVANLTLGQLEDQLYSRLGRVYSGVRRGPTASTRFQLSLARLRNIQVYVAGDVVRPGAYQISSAGTVLTALYAAGGPTANGSFRRVEVRRGAKLVDSLDLYDYLLRGINPTDVRLMTGDVVFVPVHSGYAKVAGKVARPAIYEMLPQETLNDAVSFAGGFDPSAYQARVTIHRVLPPAARGPGGRARVVVSVGADQFSGGVPPAVPLAPGDSITVFGVADRQGGYVTVKGNVWVEGEVGFKPGMKLSEAIRLAGGPKPDVYLPRILVSRVREDSSMEQLRSAFLDSTGTVQNDLPLQVEDEVRVFSRSTFRTPQYVAVVGGVRKQGRVLYRDGMTVRDAVLLADGLTDDAQLSAEIARLPADRPPGALAQTMRVSLDSSYLDTGQGGGRPVGTDGGTARAATDIPLQPYDNILILRRGEWDLQRTVVLLGQVKAPGRYSLTSKTERLSDLIARAGGLTPEAYPGGIQFYRAYAGVEPAGRDRLRRLDTDRPPPRDSLLRQGAPERVGINLPQVLKDPKSRDNIILASGDSIYIPEFNSIVLVQGGVNSPGPVSYEPGRNLDWYVDAAGGYSQNGDDHRPYVTQPNGTRQGVKRRSILADRVPHPQPGAVVFVPTRTAQEQAASNITGILSTAAQLLGALVTIIVVAKR